MTDRSPADPATGASLAPSAREAKRRVDETLRAFLAEERGALERDHPDAGPLVGEIERLVEAGGKRLRPVLAVLGHRAAGGRVEGPILRTAAALELLHTFALIHDDVMDRSPVRRGVPTTHELLGTPAAVLAGDMALALADHLLLSSGFEGEVLMAAFRRYTRMKMELGVGQYLDVSAPLWAGEDRARQVGALKSGSYTVDGPLAVGALLAGGGPEVLAALSRFAAPLGEAFQVRDDLLGVLGDDPGKPGGLDLARGRPSVVLARARALASPEDRRFLEGLAGRDEPSKEDLDRLREVAVASGAAAACARLVNGLVRRSAATLEGAPIPPEVAGDLLALAESLSVDEEHALP